MLTICVPALSLFALNFHNGLLIVMQETSSSVLKMNLKLMYKTYAYTPCSYLVFIS